MAKIKVLTDEIKFARAATEFIVAQAEDAILQRGYFSLVLAGGETPIKVYALLSSDAYRTRVDWSKVYLFWGDERCVPPDHKDSNYNAANLIMIRHLPIPESNIFRIQGELQPTEAAEAYETQLRQFFADKPWHFDLVLLGLGQDGHTASLFPYASALTTPSGTWVTAEYVEAVRGWRVTLTSDVFNQAETVMFLVAGSGKAERVHEVIEGEYDPERLPAQRIQPHSGNLIWLLDSDAANRLQNR